MKTKSLYNKYRPVSFSEVVGQSLVTSLLKNSIKTNNIHHSYLFYGTRGTGKTTVARIYAKTLNCKNLTKDFEACNKCNSCIDINKGADLDVIELDAASNNGIEEIRQIKEKANYMIGDNYKIFIIDEVHMLSKSAFNALLKILEEPPQNVIFILITTEMFKIPETIISRTLVLEFNAPKTEEISLYLQQILTWENIGFEEKAIEKIAILSKNSIRDAISLLEKVLTLEQKEIKLKTIETVFGLVSDETLFQIIYEQDFNQLMILIKQQNNNIISFVVYFINFFTNLLVNKQIKQTNKMIQTVNKITDLLLISRDPYLLLAKIVFLLEENLNSNQNTINTKTIEKSTKDLQQESLKIQPLEINNKKENISSKTKKDNYINPLVPEKLIINEPYDKVININHFLKLITLAKQQEDKQIAYKNYFGLIFSYKTHTDYKKYAKVLLKANFEYGSNQGILVSFIHEADYLSFKEIVFETNFLAFIQELVMEKILVFGILKDQLRFIDNSFESFLKKYEKTIDKTNLKLWKENEIDNETKKKHQQENLNNFFSNKLEIIKE